MLRQDQARSLIRKEWLNRPLESRTHADIIAFYGYLEQQEPELLKFKCSGDKYQKVKRFVRDLTLEFNRP